MGQSLAKMTWEKKVGPPKEQKSYGWISTTLEDVVSNEKMMDHFSFKNNFKTPIWLFCGWIKTPIWIFCGWMSTAAATFVLISVVKMFKPQPPQLPRLHRVYLVGQDEDGNLVALSPPPTQ